MRVLLGCLLSAFITGFCSNLYAQSTPSSIQGKVLTESHLPAEAATIVLLKYRDSSIVNSAIIGKDGLFNFNGVQPGSYLLMVTKVGYNKAYSKQYQVTTGQILLIRDVILSPAATQLSEVSIVSNRPDIEVRPGKIILNIQNSIMAAGNSVFDILRQSPGVRVDNNNSISIIGRQNALITIDGKPTNLSGDDLIGVLKSMQSNTIDHIELITSSSAKYDASGGGIVNIVLKKGNNIGANATVTASGGYGRYGKGSTGVVFNDRTDKFNVFGNYGYSNNKSFHDVTSDRDINFNNVLSDYHVDYKAVQHEEDNTFGLGTDYFISPNSTIGFLVSGAVADVGFMKNNNLKISNQSVLDSIITANSNVNRHISRTNYNLNYTGKLDSAGKILTANLNYYTYNRSSDEYITNDFYDPSGGMYRDPLLLRNLSPSNIHIWLSKVDFTDPLSKTSKLEAGIKYSSVTSNNDLIFGPLVNGQYQNDPNFTNHFVYTENVNAAYVNLENKFNKFNLTTGLRAEQTIAKGNSVTLNQVVSSNYLDLFPQALITYNYDDKNDLSLSYNRGIQRPNYEEINPFLYYLDLYDYRAGNPNLKPEYSNTIELSYSHNKIIVATLYTTILSGAYDFSFYEQNDTSKVNVSTNINLGTIYTYGMRLFAPVVFTNWWNANFTADIPYQRYVAYKQYGNLDKGTQDIILTGTQNFIIDKTVSAELYGYYESPTFYGVSQFKANYYVNAAIGKQLFNKRGSIKLSVTDVFNTRRDRSSVNYENVNIAIMDKVESQVAKLTFTYRLGKTSVKSTTHHTGNEDEQKRANAGN
jgi:iron complex outermembrane receptor protein